MHFEMPDVEYHAAEGLSSHGCMDLLVSPARFQARRLFPEAPSAAMKLGSMFHASVLEPDRFARSWACAPEVDRRTKAGKEALALWAEENPGVEPVAPEDWARVLGMRDAIWRHPEAAELLSDGDSEVSIFAEEGCLVRKARIDHYSPRGLVIDLKSTESIEPRAFGAAAARYSMHLQGAWYLDLAREAGLRASHFVHIAVESQPRVVSPDGLLVHAAAIYVMPEEVIERGRVLGRRATQLYLECVELDRWPGYAAGISELQFPAWGLRDEREW